MRSTTWRNPTTALLASLVLVAAGFIYPATAQNAEVQQRIAALKQTAAQNQQNIRQYEWIETTVISLKGEEKSQDQKQCYYGADGGVQKVDISESPQAAQKHGLRGKVVAKKKAELTDYMKEAVALVKSYVPPDPARIQAVKDSGNVSLNMPGAGQPAQVNLRNYVKPGDTLSIEVDPASNRIVGLTVATYLDDPKDAVTLNVRFSVLPDGTQYPATVNLVAQAKNLSVDVTNSGYRKVSLVGTR
jgi:hypothetical protein